MPKHTTPREKRKARIRKKISGTTERPRLSVYRSLNHIYAQVIDDTTGKTLAAASSVAKSIKGEVKDEAKADVAKKVGVAIAKAAIAKGVQKVVFDRNGFDYHGRIAAVATAAREAGLQF
jgi:large subunit ribosomal protein L18